MAKQPSKNVNISVSSVPLEDDADSFNLTTTPATPVVTAFSDVGPRRVMDNYDYTLDLSGAADFASGQSDDTLFDLTTNAAGGAVAVDPTGNTAGANDPNYDTPSMMASSYSISATAGGRVEFSSSLVGNGALTRAVA